MLCDFQTIGDARRCRRCGLTIRVRGHDKRRAAWAECQAIDLVSPRSANTSCVHLGPQVGEEPCGTCRGHVTLKVFRCQDPAHDVTTLPACQTCPDFRAAEQGVDAPRRIVLHFPHGLGDAVQLTTILLHLQAIHPRWEVDVEVRPGAETMFAGLCRQAFRLQGTGFGLREGSEPNVHELKSVARSLTPERRTLWFHEADACYADSPSTKAERALREVFGIMPREDLCVYRVTPSEEDRSLVRAYLAELAAVNGMSDIDRRFVLIHYQGNTSRQNKNFDERVAAALCEEIVARGFVPVILDWAGRSALVDQRRIFCPELDHALWRGRGHGDGAVIAALAERAAWCVGIDSGPGHVFAATATPTLIVWTRHHPLHYFGLSDTVTHLVPERHEELLRGDRTIGLRYFEAKYHYRLYRDLAHSLLRMVSEFLPEERPRPSHRSSVRATPNEPPSISRSEQRERLIVDGDLFVRAAHRAADMTIVRDVYFDDCYRVAELPRAPRFVIDVGAHIGCFAHRVRQRTTQAEIVCVEANPANLGVLRANVAAFTHIVPAACTYEPGDVALFNTVFEGSDNTGGSAVSPVGCDDWQNKARLSCYREAGVVPKVTLEEIVHERGWPHIDLLKLDCEGSEISILEHCDARLLRLIVGEYHDRARFDELVRRRFRDWQVRILRAGTIGLFWLRPG